ncbi:MAG: helix-turn-helix domain-containing protein, partial [Parvularculaceae bacterium]|nr:helix-turn-helix domain-containing protein [Parvularculaceae bacterium]
MSKPVRSVADIVILNAADAPDDAALLEAVNAAETVGHKLAAARKAKGLTLQTVHEGTKVKIAHLAAIELGDQSSLPAVPFAAGFVKAYAQFLGLDANAYSAAYKAEFSAGPIAPASPARSAPAKIETAPTETAIAALGRAEPPLAAINEEPPALAAPPPIAASIEVAPALEPAPAPAPVRAKSAAPPDRFVAYFGIGAAFLCVAWIGGNALLSRPAAPAPTVTFTSLAPATNAETPIVEPERRATPVPEPAAPALAETEPAIDPLAEEPRFAVVKPPKVKPAPKPARSEDPAMTEIAIADAPVVAATSPAGPGGATSGAVDPFELPAISEPTPAIAETIEPAKVIRSAAPKYPERCSARSKRVEAVTVAFDVTVEGR